MSNKHRIVRDGVPQYVAPWVSELSPKARAMIGTGPSKLDPQGQLGLPIPDMQARTPTVLDFGFKPCAPKPGKPAPSYVISEAAFTKAADLQRKLYRDGLTDDARALWEVLATIKKADSK